MRRSDYHHSFFTLRKNVPKIPPFLLPQTPPYHPRSTHYRPACSQLLSLSLLCSSPFISGVPPLRAHVSIRIGFEPCTGHRRAAYSYTESQQLATFYGLTLPPSDSQYSFLQPYEKYAQIHPSHQTIRPSDYETI